MFSNKRTAADRSDSIFGHRDGMPCSAMLCVGTECAAYDTKPESQARQYSSLIWVVEHGHMVFVVGRRVLVKREGYRK